jgi:hypothetical protein
MSNGEYAISPKPPARTRRSSIEVFLNREWLVFTPRNIVLAVIVSIATLIIVAYGGFVASNTVTEAIRPYFPWLADYAEQVWWVVAGLVLLLILWFVAVRHRAAFDEVSKLIVDVAWPLVRVMARWTAYGMVIAAGIFIALKVRGN